MKPIQINFKYLVSTEQEIYITMSFGYDRHNLKFC